MKIRANLNFFLSKRGGSLKKLCETSGIKTKESLLGFLDDACVVPPSEEDLATLFPAHQKASRQAVRKSSAVVDKKRDTPRTKPEPEQSQLEKQKLQTEIEPKQKVKRTSRRRSKRARSSSASEE